MLNKAKDLDNQIERASNSYERKQIHEECEDQFDTGSPRKVIHEQNKIISQIERDEIKLEKLIEQAGLKAARIIDKLIIDDNNLCYASSKFIGLMAIQKLLPILSSKYTLIVVFDASIRGLLNTNDSGLRALLNSQAVIHIVATKIKADETILDLASANQNFYILSNDRFSEYFDKDAFKRNRIIRHEIVDGTILVHDLDINEKYEMN